MKASSCNCLNRRKTQLRLALLGAGLAVLQSAGASTPLTFAPSYDFGTLNSSQQATFVSSIQTVLNYYSSTFETPNPVTVSIQFKADPTVSLGQSLTFYSSVSYSDFHSALISAATSTNDLVALGSIPLTNPLNGAATVDETVPYLRALGLDSSTGGLDSVISLNTSLMTLDRSGLADPSKYDLMQVAMHEINEVLGLPSGITGTDPQLGDISPIDLFRYSATGVRSFSSDPSVVSYLSIDGGVTKLAGFNQQSGGDYGDYDGSTPMVQDAFSTPGLRLNNGVAETTALDVIGYTVVPEPSSAALLLLATAMVARRRRA